MVEQVLQILARVLAVLGDRRKLADGSLRKRIGGELVTLHQALGDVTKNAKEIESMLERIVLTDEDILTRHVNLLFVNLTSLLEVQKFELRKLNALLLKNKALIEIYGDKYLNALKVLVGGKASLISFIADCVLHSPQGEYIYLPKTLNLENIQAYREAAFVDTLYLCAGDFFEVYKYSKDDIRINAPYTAQCKNLMLEAVEARTTERLEASRYELAALIKANFKIEELFDTYSRDAI